MTIREALRAAQARLESAGVPAAGLDAELLLAFVLGFLHLLDREEKK